MKCICGFENAPDARFCGGCSLTLGGGTGDAGSDAAVSGAITPLEHEGRKLRKRSHYRALLAILSVVIVTVAAAYWWLNRPPGRYKPDNSGLYRIKVDGKYGFIDRTGKTAIAPQFDDAYGFSEGLAAVKIGTKFGFMNTKGEVVITPQFDASVSSFREGLAVVQVGTKFGYINTKGLVTITPQFDDAGAFNNGRATVKLCCGRSWDGLDRKVGHKGTNRYAFIDKDGKYVGTPGFLFVSPDHFGDRDQSGDAALVRTADDRVGVMDRSGKVVIAGTVDEIGWSGFTAGLAPAATGGKWGYIDKRGEWAIEPQYEETFGFKEGLAPARVGGRWGLIDQKGKFVVNPQYDGIFGVSEGYAIFEIGKGSIPGCGAYCGYHGFIDTKGRVVVDATFVERPNPDGSWSSPIRSFSEGLAAVKTDDGWGFIDPTGKMVIDPQFDDVGSFQDGLAFVKVLGKEAYITKTGAFVVDPFPGTTVKAMKAQMTAEVEREAEQQRLAVERADEERRKMLAAASKTIVGTWRNNQKHILEIRQDGGIQITVEDQGIVITGTWSILADVFTVNPTTLVTRGSPGSPSSEPSRSRIVRIDARSYEMQDIRTGFVYTASRIK